MDHVPVHDGRERADVLDLVWRHREVVPPDAARFGVPRGWLRLRAPRSNLDTAVALDIDSAKTPETMERARIQVWPAAPADAAVVKRWNAAQDPAAPY